MKKENFNKSSLDDPSEVSIGIVIGGGGGGGRKGGEGGVKLLTDWKPKMKYANPLSAFEAHSQFQNPFYLFLVPVILYLLSDEYVDRARVTMDSEKHILHFGHI